MNYETDKFKVNWTERSRSNVITSVTGYTYQVDAWKRDYFKQYDSKTYKTEVITKLGNDDNTITIIVSRTDTPRRKSKT